MESHPVNVLSTLSWSESPNGLLLHATVGHWKCPQGLWLPEMSRRQDTGSRVKTRTGATFRARSGFRTPASICRRAISPASRLPSLSLSLMPSNVPVFREQWLCYQSKEPPLQRRGSPPPSHSRVPAGYLQKFFTSRERPPRVMLAPSPQVNQGSLCSFLCHLLALPSL